jgi:GT2 family glycosyltransferase
VIVTIGICIKTVIEDESAAFESLLMQDFPRELMKLVIVCEQSDKLAVKYLDMLAKRTGIKSDVFSSAGKGLGFSRQLVVNNAEGKYIVWIDDDFSLEKNFVTKHVLFMEANKQVGAALANEIPNRKTIVSRLGSYLTLLRIINPKATPTGGFEIFRLESIRQVGGYDKNIFGAGEDVDIARRIKSSGWQLSTNDQAIFYRKSPPATWKSLWFKSYWYGYGNYFLTQKYKIKQIRWELFPPSALWIGTRNSGIAYRAGHEKSAFFLGIYEFFRSIAGLQGYLTAHRDGYGHPYNR